MKAAKGIGFNIIMDHRKVDALIAFTDRDNTFYIIGIIRVDDSNYICFLDSKMEMYIESISNKEIQEIMTTAKCNIDNFRQITGHIEFNTIYDIFYSNGFFDKFSSKIYR